MPLIVSLLASRTGSTESKVKTTVGYRGRACFKFEAALDARVINIFDRNFSTHCQSGVIRFSVPPKFARVCTHITIESTNTFLRYIILSRSHVKVTRGVSTTNSKLNGMSRIFRVA